MNRQGKTCSIKLIRVYGNYLLNFIAQGRGATGTHRYSSGQRKHQGGKQNSFESVHLEITKKRNREKLEMQ